ncbi:hypothetical protein [Xanthomonas vesicatoria]|uniref:Uncharacterized protein n=2 Tax=Xanthomonas TaxID=338 RepID=A0ABS8L423_9XANT|nr:hypothetical protein [Xanthomonas vesicatoria]APO93290.1 hypothetical protein BI313_00555 [Xanthomonas vesicatoria]MCC8620492.1 hypothetical protein [Xanthomonas vesicatoria]MCC8630136.1 hypothetical protein [Xanthomonas vesicatoria]
MSAKYQVTDGPFSGTLLDRSRLQPWRYANGDPVVINGKEMSEWTPDYLTPIFLRVFDPQLGWSVTTDMVVLKGLELPDYANPLVENGVTVKTSFGGDVPSMLQVVKVTATLSDPEGKVIHAVSILQGIHNINSTDLGLKRALLQLYRGTGLPSSPEGQNPVFVPQKPEEAVATTPVASVSQSANQAAVAQAVLKIRPISQTASRAEGDDLDVGADHIASSEAGSAIEQPASQEVVQLVDVDANSKSSESGASSQVKAAAADVTKIDNSKIDPRFLTQLTHFAKLAGEDVRQLNDDTDAKAELVRMRRIANGKG